MRFGHAIAGTALPLGKALRFCDQIGLQARRRPTWPAKMCIFRKNQDEIFSRHHRHAADIGHLIFVDDFKRLASIPFIHENQRATGQCCRMRYAIIGRT